jgi:hypothetical protein
MAISPTTQPVPVYLIETFSAAVFAGGLTFRLLKSITAR